MTLINEITEIWPRAKLAPASVISLKSVNSADIEDFFDDIYPNAYTVLMPSGRSALRLILNYQGLERADLVSVPKYSSHCIINSVGFVATPTQSNKESVKNAIIFHQWGFVRNVISTPNIIEDSVDSLIPPNGNLFPNDGRFEIISLPKVFGTLIGGIILCQNKRDAEELKKLRDANDEFGKLHFYLRCISQFSKRLYMYWNSVEPLNTYIPSLALNDIWKKIQNIGTLIDDRNNKISLLKTMNIKTALPLPVNRYPCCWPVPIKQWPGVTKPDDHIIRHIHGNRHSDQYQKVFPVPIHHQVSINTLNDWLVNGA